MTITNSKVTKLNTKQPKYDLFECPVIKCTCGCQQFFDVKEFRVVHKIKAQKPKHQVVPVSITFCSSCQTLLKVTDTTIEYVLDEDLKRRMKIEGVKGNG